MKLLYNYIFLIAISASCLNSQIQAGGHDEKLHKMWFNAARTGDLKLVQSLIGRVDINAQDAENNTALIMATRFGQLHVTQLLLQIPGVNINVKGSLGFTVLMLMPLISDSEDTVKLFLQKSIDINAQNDSGWSTLMYAARNNRSQILKQLLAVTGININAQNNKGDTALMLAALVGHRDIIKILLNTPAIDLNIKNKEGKTALMIAQEENQTDAAELIKKKIDQSSKISGDKKESSDDKEELIERWCDAARNGNLIEIRALSGKVGINAIDKSGGTALMNAAINSRGEIIKYLLQVPGIDVNIRDKKENFTALIFASFMASAEIVKLLLQAPVDINAQKKDGWTALMFASRNDRLETVKLLLQMPNLNINAQNEEGQTALILAAMVGHREMTEVLLNAPAVNIYAKNKEGKTALMVAQEKGNEAIAELIKNKIELSAKAFEAISVYAKATSDAARDLEMAKLKSIIDQIGVDSIVDADNNTLVDKAFQVNNSKIVEFLLGRAKDPRVLLARFPFEATNPSTQLFKYFLDLAFMKHDTTKDIKECHVCQKPAAKKCSRCKSVNYCSVACQKADWQKHKSECITAKI